MAAKIRTTEVPLLLIKAKIDTSPTEIHEPTLMFQFEEQIAKTMTVDPISHLFPEAENYFIYAKIFSCLSLTGESVQVHFIFILLINPEHFTFCHPYPLKATFK